MRLWLDAGAAFLLPQLVHPDRPGLACLAHRPLVAPPVAGRAARGGDAAGSYNVVALRPGSAPSGVPNMPGSKKQGGQRGNTTSASGQKARSETSTSHKGSRVEPSHVAERAKEERVSKEATQAAKKAAKKVEKKKKG